ncbi:Complement C1q tumor necrosis factor-related protein 1 [Dissostichus eleginoides]|uniref:Complement C1q tumor necrosis factor-related protein 1 n=1 Tax=Dissostichus eleginoides TaxID=100907 RepID=A0AAD9B821_DISEL|nr:Complement C1q tumor necrosis factor-related protein 1 [Dissostichus eleginoides]
MLGVLVLLSLASLGALVPPPGSPPVPCRRCCDHLEPPEGSGDPPPPETQLRHKPEIRTYINMTILKGDKGERGDRGTPGPGGGPRRPLQSPALCLLRGPPQIPPQLESYQALVFDTVFVNQDDHFNMFDGKFLCRVPGIYFFNLNIHTWNFKETYLHIMHNDTEKVIVYAQPSDRSIMQSQSLMLELKLKDEVWVRLYKRERENAIYSDDVDVYITFNGYLIKGTTEGN